MGGKREGGGEATRRRSRGKEERRSGSGGHKNGRRWENAPNGPSGNLSQNGVLLFRCFALSLFRCFALSVFRCFAFSLSPHQEKSPSTRALRAEPARLYSTFNTLSFLVRPFSPCAPSTLARAVAITAGIAIAISRLRSGNTYRISWRALHVLRSRCTREIALSLVLLLSCSLALSLVAVGGAQYLPSPPSISSSLLALVLVLVWCTRQQAEAEREALSGSITRIVAPRHTHASCTTVEVACNS